MAKCLRYLYVATVLGWRVVVFGWLTAVISGSIGVRCVIQDLPVCHGSWLSRVTISTTTTTTPHLHPFPAYCTLIPTDRPQNCNPIPPPHTSSCTASHHGAYVTKQSFFWKTEKKWLDLLRVQLLPNLAQDLYLSHLKRFLGVGSCANPSLHPRQKELSAGFTLGGDTIQCIPPPSSPSPSISQTWLWMNEVSSCNSCLKAYI